MKPNIWINCCLVTQNTTHQQADDITPCTHTSLHAVSDCGLLCVCLYVCVCQVEEHYKMNRQTSPALQHKVSNRISDPSLPPRSESFSSGGLQQARTPPMHRSVEPQVRVYIFIHVCFCVLCMYETQTHPSGCNHSLEFAIFGLCESRNGEFVTFFRS